MTAKIQDTPLSQLSELVAAHLGLHFPRERWSDLERGVRAASRKSGHDDVNEFIRRLLSSAVTRDQIEILGSHLTVGETYFYREKRSLDIIEEHVIPELISASPPASRHLRIWSAGCATGEEPYSIAILLSNTPKLKDWEITILATDLNIRSLQTASEGLYGDWSFRGTPAWVKRRYFTAIAGGRWAIAPSIKKMVTFAHLNLSEAAYPSVLSSTNAMNVIFCRNVLMYFTEQAMKRVVHHFYRCLADNGWLIVSPAETSHTRFSDFVTVSFAEATLYRKAARRQEEMVRPFHVSGRNDAISCATIGYQESADTRASETSQGSPAGVGRPCSTEPPSISYAEAAEIFEQGRYEDSEKMAVALLLQNRNDEQAMLLLARLYANQGRLQEAFEWCEKAIAANKTEAHAHYLRATILQEQNLLQEAALSLRHALFIDPHLVLGHFALGNIALRQGKLRESEKHFENTLELLAEYQPQEILPESDGLTAGRLRSIAALQINHGNEVMTVSGRQTARPSSVALKNLGGRHS